jgi:hypothetical protein
MAYIILDASGEFVAAREHFDDALRRMRETGLGARCVRASDGVVLAGIVPSYQFALTTRATRSKTKSIVDGKPFEPVPMPQPIRRAS